MHIGLRLIVQDSITLSVNLNNESKDDEFPDFMDAKDHDMVSRFTEIITGLTSWMAQFPYGVLCLYLTASALVAICFM
jgi:hypothetical protein